MLLIVWGSPESMNPQNKQEEELRRREQELQEREQALRIKQLELELGHAPITSAGKSAPSESPVNRRYRQILNLAKFLGLVIAVVVAIRIAAWLATMVMIGSVIWVIYKLFFASDRLEL
jgi:ferric-dicitrate binding protein FerR (iron transport regulator)